jgi:hypothetical protein
MKKKSIPPDFAIAKDITMEQVRADEETMKAEWAKAQNLLATRPPSSYSIADFAKLWGISAQASRVRVKRLEALTDFKVLGDLKIGRYWVALYPLPTKKQIQKFFAA